MNGYTTAGNLDRQPDLLARLQNVVRQLNRPDIRTVSVLISKMIGDQNAGLMAVRLLHWFPKAKKAGGWVYKSWRDWNAECNLSQGQAKRHESQGHTDRTLSLGRGQTGSAASRILECYAAAYSSLDVFRIAE